jgi:FkbM family methyltransferase
MKRYWTSEIYGFGKWLRKYGFYPSFLPLCVDIDHGVPFDEYPTKYELESDAPVFLSYWHIKTQKFKENKGRQCYTLSSPFVFARKSLNIEQSEDAQGSIFFLSHSTKQVVSQKSVEEYHQELKDLPEVYKPLTICLHIHDIDRGLDREFKKLGYKVVTAGNSLEEEFTEKFYRILSKYVYTISDSIGSHAFYAIEMGIPFGLYGEEPTYINYGDPNIEMGQYTSYKEIESYKKAVTLFSGLPDRINQEQKEFVEEHLGLKYGLSRSRASFILYKSFLIWLSDLKNIREFLATCFRRLITCSKSTIDMLLDFSLRKLLTKIGFKKISKEKVHLSEYEEVKDFILSEDYRKIKEIPRYTLTKVKFLGKELNIADNASFLEMTKELFFKNIYDFKTNNKTPYIIDCGANIGLSVIYFKKLYPKSKIVAIEADPNIYNVLTQNILSYDFSDVQCINSAVWINSEGLHFSAEGSWGGYLLSGSEIEEKTIEVKALDLRKIIDRKIDFLKIDIEGAETEVLIHAQDLIVKYVDHLFFEWHSLRDERQQLGRILKYFEDNRFRYHIKESISRETPFTNRPNTRMDSQLDCFLYKV